jgi:hypothetical protein
MLWKTSYCPSLVYWQIIKVRVKSVHKLLYSTKSPQLTNMMSSKYQVMFFGFIALQISFPGFKLTKTTLRIVCFYLKKQTESCLKSINIFCVLYTFTNQIWGQVFKFKFQIQSNLVWIYIQMNPHILSLSPFSYFHLLSFNTFQKMFYTWVEKW